MERLFTVTYFRNSLQLRCLAGFWTAVNLFRKTLHHRCLTGFWIRPCTVWRNCQLQDIFRKTIADLENFLISAKNELSHSYRVRIVPCLSELRFVNKQEWNKFKKRRQMNWSWIKYGIPLTRWIIHWFTYVLKMNEK